MAAAEGMLYFPAQIIGFPGSQLILVGQEHVTVLAKDSVPAQSGLDAASCWT